jgi:hypothetical protein
MRQSRRKTTLKVRHHRYKLPKLRRHLTLEIKAQAVHIKNSTSSQVLVRGTGLIRLRSIEFNKMMNKKKFTGTVIMSVLYIKHLKTLE